MNGYTVVELQEAFGMVYSVMRVVSTHSFYYIIGSPAIGMDD